jgi:hypothetical protein
MKMFAAVSPASPYNINEYVAAALSDTTGKTSASMSITPSESTLVLLGFGQSLQTNHTPTGYTPTTNATKVLQLNIYDGAGYRAVDPLLGTNYTSDEGNYLTLLADRMVTAATYAKVILVPAAIGGTMISDWTTGNLSHRLHVALLRIRQQGWIGNADVTFKVLFHLGQTDHGAGTTQAAWEASYATLKNIINTHGVGTPQIFVPQCTMVSSVTSSTIRAAQAAVVDNVQTFSGGDIDALTGANRAADGTHLTDAGISAVADILKVKL